LGPIDIGIIDFLRGGCSHRKGLEYFAESCNAVPSFSATLCDSWDNFEAGLCHGNVQEDFGLAEYVK
jgi:hypothetical protein